MRKHLKTKFKGEILYEYWIEFEDSNGHGWASPDFILSPAGREGHKLIVEAKRTATSRAIDQLDALYLPLLRSLEPETEFTLIQVAKFTAGARTSVLDLDDVLALPPGNEVHLWHWY